MNSTEPNANFERALVCIQHFNGVIMTSFNCFIMLIIVRDDDKRNRDYRKYLCCLQMSSMAIDTFSDFYAPIVQFHKGIFISDSYISGVIGVGKFMVIELWGFAQVILVYYAMVYYRRGIVLPHGRRFNFFGWRRRALYASLQIYLTVAIGGMVYFMQKSVNSAELSLPPELHWVRSRTTYMFIKPDENMVMANKFGASAAIFPAVTLAIMLFQLISEVKRGMRKASAATLRYQRLAVRSLILQGAVPSLGYVIPSFANTGLQMATTVFQLGETFDRVAIVLSPIIYIIMTKHTFVNSLTLLYCSPVYRTRIAALFTRSADVIPIKISSVTPESDMTVI